MALSESATNAAYFVAIFETSLINLALMWLYYSNCSSVASAAEYQPHLISAPTKKKVMNDVVDPLRLVQLRRRKVGWR